MRKLLHAAAAALVLISPTSMRADGASSHAYVSRGALAKASAVDPARLVLVSTGAPIGASAVRSRAQRGAMRDVMLNGIPMQMDEVDIRARIAAGAYDIVFPAAAVASQTAGTAKASYPPAWF